MGKSSSQVTGYKHYLGFHLGLCVGPIDYVDRILFDDRVAWQRGSGSGTAGSAASPDPGAIGTVSGMAAVAGGGGGEPASITFPGTLAGIGVGSDYDLTLASGSTITVTVLEVGWDGDNGITRWRVEPNTTAFAAQIVEVGDPAADDPADPPSLDGTAGRIRIDAPDLFGGEGLGQEGGVVGDVDILMGEADQGQNDYLAELFGETAPHYRGICSLVFRDFYMGLSPYFRQPSGVIHASQVGNAAGSQWLPEIATIDGGGEGEAEVIQAVGATWKYRVEAPGSSADYSAAAYDDSGWDTGPGGFGQDFGGNTPPAQTFVSPAVGKAIWLRGTIPGGDTRRVRVDASHDDGPTVWVDGSPVELIPVTYFRSYAILPASDDDRVIAYRVFDSIPTGNPTFIFAGLETSYIPTGGQDKNPAHMLRQWLTDPVRLQKTVPTALIGTSFAAAAQDLYDEAFGLSFAWREETAEEAIGEILRHIDGIFYTDRRTGLLELALVRDDYDAEAILALDDEDGDVIDWGSFARRARTELVSQVTVTYLDEATLTEGAVTVQDVALATILGGGRATALSFLGIWRKDLAARVAARELRALSQPVWAGSLTLNRKAHVLDPGSVFRLTSVRRGLDVILRVIEVDLGSLTDTAIRVEVIEDVFSLGAAGPVGGAETLPGPVTTAPAAMLRRLVTEAPYWLSVQLLGHADTDAALVSDPDAGVVLAAGQRPSADTYLAEIWADGGTGAEQDGTAQVVPTALLDAALSADPTAITVPVESWTIRTDARPGMIAAIGAELVRIDAVSASSITVGRGVLDTVPVAHEAGEALVVFGAALSSGTTPWTAGQDVEVRLLPVTPRGRLALAAAPIDTVSFDSRQIRPLPPGNVRVNDQYFPPEAEAISGDLVFTWSHRSRTAQTSIVLDAYTAGDIGPEAGVAYVVDFRWQVDGEPSETVALELDAGTGTTFTVEAGDWPSPPGSETKAYLRLRAVRTVGGDDYYEWTNREFLFRDPNGAGTRWLLPDESGFWATADGDRWLQGGD